MSKLVQCISTQAFLTKEGAWTKHIHEACHLPDFSAHTARTQFPGQGLQIYYSFDLNKSSQWDFSLALTYTYENIAPK